jgi:hypothetical protein
MLLERGIVLSYETVTRWAKKFGPEYARALTRKTPSRRDIWHLVDDSRYFAIVAPDDRVFGVERSMFGTNFPVDLLFASSSATLGAYGCTARGFSAIGRADPASRRLGNRPA